MVVAQMRYRNEYARAFWASFEVLFLYLFLYLFQQQETTALLIHIELTGHNAQTPVKLVCQFYQAT